MPHGQLMTDPENERQRLAQVYAELSDTALLELAADAASLTPIAREALRAQLSARSLEVALADPKMAANSPQPSQLSGPLVMVNRFRDMPEAEIAASLLDSSGIDCFLADENTIRMDWLWSNLLGGFKLMVRPEDLDEARQLLQEANLAGNTDAQNSTENTGDANE